MGAAKAFLSFDAGTRPRGAYQVLLINGHSVRATLSGRMRFHRIHVVTGDEVTVELTPFDLSKGRIVFRNK